MVKVGWGLAESRLNPRMADLYTKDLTWTRWAGRSEELASATQLIIDELEAWIRDAKTSQSGSGKVNVNVVTALREITKSSDNPDDLTNLSSRDLMTVESIWVECTWAKGAEGGDVRLRVNREAPALSIEIYGRDRTRVEGLASQLEDLLGPGERFAGWYQQWMWVLVASAFWIGLLFSSRLVLDALGFKDEIGVTWDEVVWIILMIPVSLIFGLSLRWITPDLELLESGQRTRWQRFGKRFGWGLLTIVLGIVASAIWSYLN